MTLSSIEVPSSHDTYGRVVCRIIRRVGDGDDAGTTPDALPMTGTITFEPITKWDRTVDYSALASNEAVTGRLNPLTGELMNPGQPSTVGVDLLVGLYRVSFKLDHGQIGSFDIEVKATHTPSAPLDLVYAAPYSPPPGVTVQTMLVPADAVIGQILGWTEAGLDWVDMAAAAGGVSSVAGRTGAVVLSSADLTDAASLTTDAELTAGLAGKADSSHTHAPEDITGTAVITTDPRLSDARTPTAHTHTLADVTDYEAPDLSGYVTTTDPRLSDDRDPTAHAHPISDVTGLQASLDGKAASGHTHAELHTHANAAALALVSGTNTGDEPDASTTTKGVVELATTAEASAGTDTTRAVTPAGVAAAIAGVGGGVTDHGALSGLTDDDHTLYALADGTRGTFAAPLGADDNYVTDAEKVKLANLSGTNTGDQTLPTWSTLSGMPAVIAAGATQADARTAIGAGTSSFTGAYADLSGKPTLGTAAATDATAYATAAQGALADTALQASTGQPINAQTGTTYTLAASDAGKLVTLTNAAAITLTVPASTFTAGQRVDIGQRGAGVVTVVAGSGMTVNPPPGGSLVMQGQYAYASLVFISPTVADLVGLVAAP